MALFDSKARQFEIHFSRYKNLIYDYAIAVLNDRETAGDILQETFIKLYEQMNRNSNIKDVKSWLFITARNLCFNHKRNNRSNIPLGAIHNDIPDGKSPDDERLYILAKAMWEIEDKYREALILKEYQALSYAEIATILQTSVSSVKSLLFRARVSLREKFNHLVKEGEKHDMR